MNQGGYRASDPQHHEVSVRTMPLLFLTLALSTAADGPAETGGDGWTRPNDREPADDWSERTGVPSPFPCRADMVWCEAERATLRNPDGSDRGAWVPSAAWRQGTDAYAGPGEADETPYVDALIQAFGDKAQAESLAGALAGHGVEARISEEQGGQPAYGVIARVQVPDRRCGVAVATYDPRPLAACAAELAKSAEALREAATDLSSHADAAAAVREDRIAMLQALGYTPNTEYERFERGPGPYISLESVTSATAAEWVALIEPHGIPESPIPDPTEGEPLWAYVARLSSDERFLSWPDDPNGDPVHPLHVYRLVEGGFILVPPDAPSAPIDADDSH